jgi:hypothetical protein
MATHSATTGPLAYPDSVDDEGELFVRWLDLLRQSLISKLDGLSEEQARWHPDGKLLSVLGVVNHLTHVEWRWIDGAFIGLDTSRSEEEFHPVPTVPVGDIVTTYQLRGADTTKVIRRAASLSLPCVHPMAKGRNLRWVLLHLVEGDGTPRRSRRRYPGRTWTASASWARPASSPRAPTRS